MALVMPVPRIIFSRSGNVGDIFGSITIKVRG
jgi:hypothetical protein